MYWRPEPLASWDVRSIAVLADNSVAVAGSFKVATADYVSLAINRGTTWEPIRVRHNVQIVLPYADGMFLGGWPWVRWWDGHSSEPFPELLFGGVQALALLPQGLFVGGAGQFSRVNAAPFSYSAAAFDF